METDKFWTKIVKGKLDASIRMMFIIAEIFLVISAVVLYREYGRGIGYYLLIVFPLVSILIGMGSGLKLKHEYWIVAAVLFHLSVMTYAYKSSPGDIAGFVPFCLVYVFLSVAAGFTFHKKN